MFIFQVHHTLHPQHIETYRAATQILVNESLNAQTALRIDVMQDKENPSHFILLEVYQDKDARLAHLSSEHFTRWRDTVFNLFAEMPHGEELNAIQVDAAPRAQRLNISSGAKWEDIVGYCRAVRVGDTVEVAGTTAVDESGEIVGINDAYEQTKFTLAKIEKALIQAGATMKDVVRTRLFVTDISKWEEIGRAHGEYFREIKPASSMIEVKGLIDPKMLVEIEVTARIADSRSA